MAGIYIHIPYCRKLCSYCDFYHVIAPGNTDAFVSALLKEAELRKDYLGKEEVSTIYFGGGTPSLLSASDLSGIIKALRATFSVEEDCEITAELNPDDVTGDYASALADTGINRISMGVQSWKDSHLKMLNRRHNSAQAANALETLFRAGFENVTIDLIYGLPGMTTSEWASNIDFSLSFAIRHLSAYHLTIEAGTVFGKMREKGLLSEIEEEESTAQFNTLLEKTEDAGFIHYEISNFGKPGYFSLHNSNYWKQVPYLGLGPSAHSYNGYSRQWNLKDVKKYLGSARKGNFPFELEELNSRTRFNEYIMTSLRTMWGIDLEYVERVFEKEGYDYIVNLSGKFREYGLMRQEKKNLVLTNQGILISDNIISEFMMPGEG
ncbi:MAG: radical SAM family heme chaperone HemW [Bacteroidales bacterium]|jgi:oxygen-independent coproporphyrinogen-3 oxidase|nr:radical SAM family heme chaperone HemW [Bacteroidales bacterium]MCU0407980.1 radical SAM family heme chaperone HemW [Bacteroidales bacterium]